MIGQFIRALIYICCLALCFYLAVWVLGVLGIILPAMVQKILVVIFILMCVLVLWQLFAGHLGGINWWGRQPPKE